MKKILILFIALVFTLSVVGPGFSEEVTGTVTKIEITVKDDKGKETKLKVEDTTRRIEVGDNVVVKDGKVKQVEKKRGKKRRAIEGC
ncbi:MAG: hypothetical protein OEZ31_05995 [Nitrospirota bacterium]|nr:hypothetical protein [Nitrospirota bacterium]